LYRSADALEPGGGARDLADSLYGELYGLRESGGARQSLFRYFHGRSSLTTWLRAVLAQRYVDRVRANRRLEPLPEEGSAAELDSGRAAHDPDRARHVRVVSDALVKAVSHLDPRDRLRLGLYYAQQLKLAEIGRLLGEHEGTVSRHLTRTRRLIRGDIERQLRDEEQLGEAEIAECFASVMDDAGPLDVVELFGSGGERKNTVPDRSI
jgi:RNA polymerase sigma factor (sigma-70 family)